ncbi:MAG: YicC/YloC family endoribonuclease, partial [bacterium]|nr:YicC/YloC family endoribonuclease [bacterium]
MIRSMTGYGRASAHINNLEFKVELKSVNHKGLEISIRAPKEFAELESAIYSFIAKQIQRGRIEVYINLTQITESSVPNVVIDQEIARYYLNVFKQLARDLQISEEIKLSELIELPGVVRASNEPKQTEASESLVWENIEPIIATAVAELTSAREREGDLLAEDVYSRLTHIELDVKNIQKLAPEVVTGYRQRLQTKLNNLVEDRDFDPIRIAQEIALLAERSDITEELVRIDSHLDQFRNTMESEGAIGRRLDFILQELFREISTTGAKASHAGIAELVVDIK